MGDEGNESAVVLNGTEDVFLKRFFFSSLKEEAGIGVSKKY